MELNLLTFHEYFPDEEACFAYVVQQRWPDGLACINCGSVAVYACKTRRLFKCKDCNKQFSPIVGTIFENTHLPLRTWFMAIYLKVTDNISTRQLGRRLKLGHKTAQHLAHRILHAMAEENLVLTKPSQADEMYHGPISKGRSSARYSKKYAVLGAIEQGPDGRVVLEVTKQPDSTVVREFFDAHIAPGTPVTTDESRIYNWLKYHRHHQTVNHSQHEYVRAGVTTNAIENAFKHARITIRTHIKLTGEHLSTHLGGYQFRFNNRNKCDTARFITWFSQAWGKKYAYNQMVSKKAVQPLALRGWARKRAMMPVQMSLFDRPI